MASSVTSWPSSRTVTAVMRSAPSSSSARRILSPRTSLPPPSDLAWLADIFEQRSALVGPVEWLARPADPPAGRDAPHGPGAAAEHQPHPPWASILLLTPCARDALADAAAARRQHRRRRRRSPFGSRRGRPRAVRALPP